MYTYKCTDLHLESDLPTRLILKTALGLEWVENRECSIDEQLHSSNKDINEH